MLKYITEGKRIDSQLDGLRGCFVAGGAITSLFTNNPINDWDIYPKTVDDYEDALVWAYENKWHNCFVSDRCLSFTEHGVHAIDNPEQLQIMSMDVYPTAESIFEKFDFTVNMGAYDTDTKSFVLHPDFLRHCSQRFLQFNTGTTFPYGSARRVKKYTDKGYTIGTGEFMKILLACQAKPINSWEDFKHQMGGIYGECIQIPTDVEFSLDQACKAVSAIQFTKLDEPDNLYHDFESAIIATSQKSRDYIPLKSRNKRGIASKLLKSRDSNHYYVDLGGEWVISPYKPQVGVERSLDLMFPGGKAYKIVEQYADGSLHSIHHPSFIYKESTQVTSAEPGIFILEKNEVYKKLKYQSRNLKTGHSIVVIELLVDFNNVNYRCVNHNETTAFPAFVNRVCDPDEFAAASKSVAKPAESSTSSMPVVNQRMTLTSLDDEDDELK